MVKVAVVGLGKMGLLHASLLNVVPGVKLVALCEKSRLISRFSKNIFSDVKLVSDVTSLAELNLDGVYITTPTSTHFMIIKTIIEQGICRNIFIEKPLASSASESRQICELVGKSTRNGVSVVGYNRRANVTFRKAKELIADGILGEPVNFESYAFSSDFLNVGAQSAHGNKRGGVLRDLGCHAIDLANWFMGNLNLKSIKSSKVSTDGTLDSVNVSIATDKGMTGEIKTSWCEVNYRLPEIGFVVEGTTGHKITANDDKVELSNQHGLVKTWHKQDLNDNVNYMLGGTDYYREDEEYIKAIITGKQIEPGFSSALKVDELIDSIEKLTSGTN